jgi:hypothetical protein
VNTTLFFLLLFVHVVSLIVAFGAVMTTDYFGLRWMRHRVRFPHLLRVAGTTERLIWIGWAGLVASGVPLALLKGHVDRLMVLKLFCVALAGANGYVLHRVFRAVERYAQADAVPSLLMFRLGGALLLSQIAWWSALGIGFLHRHVSSVIEWPARPWLWIGVFVVAVLALWRIGERVLRRQPSRVRVAASDEAQRHAGGPGPTLDPLGKESAG